MKYLVLALKNMRNNRTRTLLTMLGVAVAVFVLTFFQSMRHTMHSVVAAAGKDNNLVAIQQNVW
jgi:cell division protein FtsX